MGVERRGTMRREKQERRVRSEHSSDDSGVSRRGSLTKK